MNLPTDSVDLWLASTRRNADSWTVRGILSQYLSVPPDEVRIVRSAEGKPMLDAAAHGADEDGQPRLHYSVSHARGTLLVAIADRPLGIDVESTESLETRPLDGVIRYLTPAERETLAVVPDADRALATLICWTRKEAYAKADGRGLSIGFDRFEVSCAPGSAPRILRCDEQPEECERWQLIDLPPIEGIVGTLAIEASPAAVKLRLRRWRA